MNTPSRWQRIKDLFAETLTIPPDARLKFLKTVGADEPELAREVRMLLHADREDDFLEPPEFAIIRNEDDAQSLIGRRIGSYRVEELIGVGGTSRVYRGRRVEGGFDQNVAIKVLKRGVDTDHVLAQFRREQQTLAMLSHPSIARLYDGGAASDGRPYFIMEFVEGLPIVRFCNERKLSLRQRLRLFLAVCDAIGYAHRRLVVHRDLKPANILVTGDGLPKLLDFGIAKMVDDPGPSEATRPIERRLTPDYASPEQMTGQPVTTASDVYSLGVVLYELLTGIRPHEIGAKTPSEFERTVCGVDAESPSTALVRTLARWKEAAQSAGAFAAPTPLQMSDGSHERIIRILRGDIDTILLAALRREPDRRYGSVEAFAEDIRRYLACLPVAARKDTLWYRTRKFVGRHRAASAAAVVIVAVIGGSMAGIMRYAHIANDQWRIAKIERNVAEVAASEAAKQRDAAYEARAESKAVLGFLITALSAGDVRYEGGDITMQEFLEQAAAKLEYEFPDRPRVRAFVQGTIGRTYSSLGKYEPAERHVSEALDGLRRTLGDDHLDVAQMKVELATILYVQGRHARAEKLVREALQTVQNRLNAPDDARAETENVLAVLLRATGRLDEAEQTIRHALNYFESDPNRRGDAVALSYNNLGNIQLLKGLTKDAAESHRTALRLRQSMYPADHPLVLQSLHNLARALFQLGEDDAHAISMLRTAIVNGERTLGPEHPEFGGMLRDLGCFILNTGDYAGALEWYRRSDAIFEKQLAPTHPRRIEIKVELGHCLYRIGRFEESERLLATFLNRQVSDNRDGNMSESARSDLVDLAWRDLYDIYHSTGRIALADELRRRFLRPPPRTSHAIEVIIAPATR